jgi:hypothetical protein
MNQIMKLKKKSLNMLSPAGLHTFAHLTGPRTWVITMVITHH